MATNLVRVSHVGASELCSPAEKQFEGIPEFGLVWGSGSGVDRTGIVALNHKDVQFTLHGIDRFMIHFTDDELARFRAYLQQRVG